MELPAIRAELKEQGFNYVTLKTCPCGSAMELWGTPDKEMVALKPMTNDQDKVINHFSVCERAKQFRRAEK